MSLTRSEAVIQLGKRLVQQLDAGDDLLASWMAHDIAQKIEVAQKAPPQEKENAHNACAKAILEIWRHRSVVPKHLRPLGKLEAVIRTIASLDVDQTDHRYYPEALREAAIAEADDTTKRWLELAIGLDYSARVLIEFALRSAARSNASDTEPWVKLAREAGAGEGTDVLTVRFILGKDLYGDTVDDKAEWEERLSRIEGFAELSSCLAREFRVQLGLKETGDE